MKLSRAASSAASLSFALQDLLDGQDGYLFKELGPAILHLSKPARVSMHQHHPQNICWHAAAKYVQWPVQVAIY
jgi:hypothetical protein